MRLGLFLLGCLLGGRGEVEVYVNLERLMAPPLTFTPLTPQKREPFAPPSLPSPSKGGEGEPFPSLARGERGLLRLRLRWERERQRCLRALKEEQVQRWGTLLQGVRALREKWRGLEEQEWRWQVLLGEKPSPEAFQQRARWEQRWLTLETWREEEARQRALQTELQGLRAAWEGQAPPPSKASPWEPQGGKGEEEWNLRWWPASEAVGAWSPPLAAPAEAQRREKEALRRWVEAWAARWGWKVRFAPAPGVPDLTELCWAELWGW